MMTEREKLIQAIRKCREGGSCPTCPLQEEICDELFVDMTDVPTELLYRIEMELANKRDHRLN